MNSNMPLKNENAISTIVDIGIIFISGLIRLNGKMESTKSKFYCESDSHPGTNKLGRPTKVTYKNNGKRGGDGVLTNEFSPGTKELDGNYRVVGNGDICSYLEPILDPAIKYNICADILVLSSPLINKGFSLAINKFHNLFVSENKLTSSDFIHETSSNNTTKEALQKYLDEVTRRNTETVNAKENDSYGFKPKEELYASENTESKQTCSVSGKLCFSQRDAGIIKNQYNHHRNGLRMKKIVHRSYRCPYCRTWHLTSVKEWDYAEFSERNRKKIPVRNYKVQEVYYA